MYAYFCQALAQVWTILDKAKIRNPVITTRLRCSEVGKAMWRRQHHASYLVDEDVVDVVGKARRH